jgi:hypothetical protein
MGETAEKVNPAVYLPFRTFLSSIEALEHGLPKKLDRTMWRQAGIVQGQIMAALRFFSLVNDNDEPTPALHRLIDARDKRPEMIGSLLRHAYPSIIEHDLTKMTPKMLEELMGAYSVQGDTRRKAVAFFLRAAQFADMPMHHLLERQIRVRSASAPKRKRKKANGETEAAYDNGLTPPAVSTDSSTTKSVTLRSGTVITLKIAANWLEMSPEERAYVFGLVDTLRKVPDGAKPEEVDE